MYKTSPNKARQALPTKSKITVYVCSSHNLSLRRTSDPGHPARCTKMFQVKSRTRLLMRKSFLRAIMLVMLEEREMFLEAFTWSDIRKR